MWGFPSSDDNRVSWRSTTCGFSASRRFFSSVSRAGRLLQLNCSIVKCSVGRCCRRRPRLRRRVSRCRLPSDTGGGCWASTAPSRRASAGVLAVLAGGRTPVGAREGSSRREGVNGWVSSSIAPSRRASAGVLAVLAGGRAPVGAREGASDWIGASTAPSRRASAGVLVVPAGGRAPFGVRGGSCRFRGMVNGWVGTSVAPSRRASAGVLAVLAGGRTPDGVCGGGSRWSGHLHSSRVLACLSCA